MDTIKQYLDNTICYRLLTSRIFMLIQTVVAAVCFHLKAVNISLMFFAVVIIVMLATSKDMSPLVTPIMLAAMTIIANYGSTPAQFSSLFPLAGLLIVTLVMRPFIFHVKFVKGQMFWSLLLVSLSLILGGVGYLKPKQYFDIVPLYYVFGLGIGMLIVYLGALNYTFNDSVHNPTKVLSRSMLFVGLLGMAMIYPVAIEGFIKDITWSIQWSNNLSTYFIIAMPFAFYRATKTEKFGFLYFGLGILEFFGTLFTLSRGGILFGSITFVMCLVATIICSSKRNKRVYSIFIAMLAITITTILLSSKDMALFIKELMEVSTNEARVGLFKTAIENFLAHPLFGAGLAFKGEYYYPQKWAIYWYHSTPFQIIGSLGLLGIVAYGIQYYKRAKICLKRPSKFNVFATISLLGFELMALVNPGAFTPVPSMMIFTAILAYIEINNRERVPQNEMIFHKHGGANWREVYNTFDNKRYQEPPQYVDNADTGKYVDNTDMEKNVDNTIDKK